MPELGPADLDRRSTAEMAASYLRTRLLTGQFPPGTPMRESALAPQVGVSRATMREALRQLAHERLLTYHIHRGMLVTSLTSADVVDIYTARRVIELAAISAASERPLDLMALRDCVERHFAAVKQDDVAAIVETDMRFHHEVVKLGASPRLGNYHARLTGDLFAGHALCPSATLSVDLTGRRGCSKAPAEHSE
jgi:DNA-binding GntR family transcriptional regulator